MRTFKLIKLGLFLLLVTACNFEQPNELEKTLDLFSGTKKQWETFIDVGGINKYKIWHGIKIEQLQVAFDEQNRLVGITLYMNKWDVAPKDIRTPINKMCSIDDEDWDKKNINKDNFGGYVKNNICESLYMPFDNRLITVNIYRVSNNVENDQQTNHINKENKLLTSKLNQITEEENQTQRDFEAEAMQGIVFVNNASIKVEKSELSTFKDMRPSDVATNWQFEQSFRKLMGDDFEDFLDNTGLATVVEINHQGLYGEGMRPKTGGDKSGAFFITSDGRLYSVLVDNYIKDKIKIYGEKEYSELPEKLKIFISHYRN